MLHQQPCAFSGQPWSIDQRARCSGPARLPGLIAALAWLCLLAPAAADPVKSDGLTGIEIDNAPVFVLSGGDPNMILTLDDSGSMNLGFLPDDIWVSGTRYVDSFPQLGPRDTAALTNPQYYDPAVTYPPPRYFEDGGLIFLPQSTFSEAPLDPLYHAWCNACKPGPTTTCPNCDASSCTLDLGEHYAPVWTAPQAGQVCTELTASSPAKVYSVDPTALQAFKNANPTLVTNVDIGKAWAKHCMKSTSDPGDCPAFYYRMKRDGTYGNGIQCMTLYANMPKPADFPTECLEWVKVGSSADWDQTIWDRTGTEVTDKVNQERQALLQDQSDDHSLKYLAKKNFANWFSYYRTRFLTVQSVLGRVMPGLPKKTRLGYQGLIAGQFGPDDAAYTTLSETFAPYVGDAPELFYNWLYRQSASTNTYLVSSALRVLEFGRSEQAYRESPEMKAGALLKPADDVSNPLLGCRNNLHVIFTDGFWEDQLALRVNPPFAAQGTAPPDWLKANVDGSAQVLASNPRGVTAVGPQHDTTAGAPATYDPSADYAKVYRDANIGMLADVTFQSWIEDLRPQQGSDTDPVPPMNRNASGTLVEQFWRPGNDLADWQHITTMTVGFGVAGNVKYPPGDWTAYTPPAAGLACTTGGTSDPSGNIFLKGFPGNLAATGLNGSAWCSDQVPAAVKVDDTWHAGINGRGDYLSAGDPTSLVSAFTTVLNVMSILAGDSSAAAAATTTGSTASADRLYQARMNPADWGGDVRAFQISDGRGNAPCPNVVVAGQPCVDASLGKCDAPYCTSAAATLSTDLGGDFKKRLIFTAAAGVGRAFGSESVDWNHLTPIQRLDFLRAAGFTGNDPADASGAQITQAKLRLDYVAGDQSHEQTGAVPSLRKRGSLLGAFSNAAPVAVGAPEFYYNAPGYLEGVGTGDAYKYTDRETLIYAGGAMDGMLHAFKADTLSESFAFIPPVLMGLKHAANAPLTEVRRPGLRALSDPGYTALHPSYVDGPLAKGDVRFGAEATGDWHTVLVAGLGLGAQALYALDVSDPTPTKSGFADELFLWQFIDRDDGTTTKQHWDPDLGYVFGRPAIVRIRGASGDTSATPTWVAITGNGYNSAEDDGSRAAGCDDKTKDLPTSGPGQTNALCGQAVLYVLNAKTGEQTLPKFETGVGRKHDPLHQKQVLSIPGDPTSALVDDPADAKLRRPNALGQPTVVATTVRTADSDLLADYAYAVDLFGNLYRFDLTGQSQHRVRKLFSATAPSLGVDASLPQSVTSPVVVARHPTARGNLVMFGTGQYLSVADARYTQVQSFYAIWDQDSDTQAPVTRNELLKQRFSKTDIVTVGASGTEVTKGRTSSSEPMDWSTRKGWYIDFDIEKTEDPGGTATYKGERVVVAPEVSGWRLTFVSLVPEGNRCAGAGYSWINTLDLRTGAPFQLSPFDYNLDGTFSDKDLLKTSDTTTQAGTSVRFTPGGKNTGVYTATSDFGDGKGRSTSVVSTSEGGLEAIDNNLFLQWRVWQQLP